jgi:hypothetical protein
MSLSERAESVLSDLRWLLRIIWKGPRDLIGQLKR